MDKEPDITQPQESSLPSEISESARRWREQQRQEALKPPTAKIQLAKPKNYEWARRIEKVQQLEDGERSFLQALVNVSKTYDSQVIQLLPDVENRTEDSEQLLQLFEGAIRHLNPKGKQISSKAGVGEIIEEKDPLKYSWEYGNLGHYRQVRQEHGHAGFLAMYLVENTALSSLHHQWMKLDEVRRDLGLESTWEAAVNRSPYLAAKDNLKRRLVGMQCDELDVIVTQGKIGFEFGDPKTAREARDKALEKANLDLGFAIVTEGYDAQFNTTSRQIHTYTIDPETGIRFTTNRGFERKGKEGDFEPWGTVGISGFGPNGEIYYLTPTYKEPRYSTKKGDQSLDNFHPFYRGKGTYGGIAPRLSDERQIEIWRAYSRGACNVEDTKKGYRREGDWRYGLGRLYWGEQMGEVARYELLVDKLKKTVTFKEAVASDFGRIRFGIQLRESGVVEAGTEIVESATPEQLRQIKELFEKYWQNPKLSELVYQPDRSYSYVQFSYPNGSGTRSYPDDYGKVINVRLSKNESRIGENEVLIRDAYDVESYGSATGYLRIRWNDKGEWKVDRGRRTHTTDAYFLEPEEEKNSVSKLDAETVLIAFKLLTSPKKPD